jgi:hypothetical protein
MIKTLLAACMAFVLPFWVTDASFGQIGYERYVGKHPLEVLHQDISLRLKFRAILEEDFELFLRNLEMAEAMELSYGLLLGVGTARYSRGQDSAILCVDVYDGSVYAAVFSNGTLVRFYGAYSLTDLPEPVSEWAMIQASRADPFYDTTYRLLGSR